jgi:hypothetical protein
MDIFKLEHSGRRMKMSRPSAPRASHPETLVKARLATRMPRRFMRFAA